MRARATLCGRSATVMGARRRRAHRELVGLDVPTPGDEEYAGASSRSKTSTHASARGRKSTEQGRREFLQLVVAFVALAVVLLIVFVERVTHGHVLT